MQSVASSVNYHKTILSNNVALYDDDDDDEGEHGPCTICESISFYKIAMSYKTIIRRYV